MFNAKTTSITPSASATGGLDFATTSEHDWMLGAVYLAIAILVAAFLAGLAQLVEDTHDSRKLLSELLFEMSWQEGDDDDEDDELPPVPGG